MVKRQDFYFFLFVFSAFLLINPGRLNLDDYHRLVAVVSIIEYGRLDLEPSYLPETGYVYYRSPDGRLFVHWGFISSALYLPAALLGKIFKTIFPFIREIESNIGKPLLVERFLGSMIVMPFIMLVNVGLLQRILRKYLDIPNQWIVYLLLILAFFSTQLLVYSSGFEEGFMILLFLVAFIFSVECEKNWTRGLGIGTLAGLALNSRYYIGVPVFLLFVIWEGLKREKFLNFITFFLITLFPYALIYALYNYARYGSISPDGFFQTYVKYGFSSPEIVQLSYTKAIRFVWERLGGQKGIFIYNPILMLIPWGILILFRERTQNTYKNYLLTHSCSIAVCYLIVHALLTWGSLDWASWGPRYLTAAVPFLFLLSAPAILRMIEYYTGGSSRLFTVKGFLFIVLIFMSCFIQLLSVLGWDETEMYQGHSRNHIIQRAQNIWNISLHGNPLTPHQITQRVLLTDKKVTEVTNKHGVLEAVDVKINTLYEGFSLWPITLGYALGWSTWKVGGLILINLFVVCFFGFQWIRCFTGNQYIIQTPKCL